MEPFSICCTTCQARLKVRDAEAVGKILPCPKCGSMVMVERPASPNEVGPPAQSPNASSAAASTLLGGESFDSIDQLLDETPAQSSSVDERWRSEATDASQPPEVVDRGQDAVDHEDNSPDTTEPVQSESSADTLSESTNWMSTSALAARKHALWIGGLVVGAGVAISITGYFLTRPDSSRS